MEINIVSGNLQEAIADYNQAIQLQPDLATGAYSNIGLARYKAGDLRGAIADLQQSADLFQAQGKEQDYQDAIAMLRLLLH